MTNLNDGYALISSGGIYTPTGAAPTFNVKNFGAIGNGIANDTAAIHAADIACVGAGGHLHFPAGNYNVGSNLTITSPLMLDESALWTIAPSVTQFTVNGKIHATREQQIISGSTQTQIVNPSTSGPNLTVTAPFGISVAQIVNIKITTGGTLGTMAFEVSLDNGSTYFGPFTSSATASYAWTILGFNINVAFPAGTYVLNAVYTVICGGIISFGKQNTNISVKWFGAKGDNSTDDTTAIQSAFSYFNVGLSGNSGTITVPPGIYKISKTIFSVGNTNSAIRITGDHTGAAFENSAMFLWNGTAGTTMFDFYGLNQCTFENLVFHGNNTAGCGTWFHTNQGQNLAPTNGLYFDKCQWTNIVGGIYAACALGDSVNAPANVTIDLTGHTMVTSALGGFNTTGKNCILHATITGDVSSGNNQVTINAYTGSGSFDAGQSVWIFDSNGNDGYRTNVTNFNISTNVLTLAGTLPFTVHAATTTISLGYPNAVAISAPTASASVTVAQFNITGLEVAGGLWRNGCIWNGGGTLDTTINTNHYCYACCAVYGSFNTEQFGFRDSLFGTAAQVFGFFGPDCPNNELFFDNIQFGTFSGACVYVPGSFTKIGFNQCATESNNAYGVGYTIWAPDNHVNATGCELLAECHGNPSPIANGTYNGRPTMWCGQLTLRQCIVMEGNNDSVTPAVISNYSVVIDQCTWSCPDADLTNEVNTQIPVFDSNLNDLTRSIFGQTNFGEVAQHHITLRSNLASIHAGPITPVPDQIGTPIELHSLGAKTSPFPITSTTTFVPQTWRNNARTVTTQCIINSGMPIAHGRRAFLCQLPAKCKVVGVYFATTAAWSSAITISMGTDADTTAYTTWTSTVAGNLSGFVPITNLNNIVRMDAIPWDQAPSSGGTWSASRTIGVQFDNTFATQTTGQTSIYITIEEG